MADGVYKFSVHNTLGYYRNHFGRLVIEPMEAKIIEYIYESCLEGASVAEIAAALTEQRIKSPMGHNHWSPGTIRSILHNEKYCGDALMQKTYTKDFRTHKSIKNVDYLQTPSAMRHRIPALIASLFCCDSSSATADKIVIKRLFALINQ